jgi:hypothetical protein
MTQTDHSDCPAGGLQLGEAVSVAEENPPSPVVWKSRLRTGAVWFLMVATVLMITVEAPLVWTSTTVLNTDGWVAATDSLAESPAVQDAISAKASNAIVESLDMRSVVQEYLPDQASFLAVPLADAVDSIIVQKTDDFVRSSSFPALWKIVNQNGHAALMSVLTQDNEGAVRTSNGTITLDTGVVVQAVMNALEDDGFALAGYTPTDDLDTDIVLFSSPQLANAQVIIGLLNNMFIPIGVLACLFAAAVLALAADRRKAVMRLSMGIFIAMVVSILAIDLMRPLLIASIPGIDSVDSSAVDAVYRAVLAPLLTGQRIVALAGLLVWALALAVGRPLVLQGVGLAVDAGSRRVQASVFCQKVVLYQRQVSIVGCVVAGTMLLLPVFETWQSLLVLVVILAIWLSIIRGIAYLGSKLQR